jgi:hypothetical protein
MFGEKSNVIVFDTGVSSSLSKKYKVSATSAAGINKYDSDGHGSAISELILAIAPKAKLESHKVMQSYSEGNIWNLISGMTSLLYDKSNCIVNISLGINPSFVNSLGPGAVSFKEAMTNIISSASNQKCFIVSAAGNDGASSLRWPAAATDALAVGSYNSSTTLSTFSNYSESAFNYIVAPGGEIRSEDNKFETFGKYGKGLSREIYGTSFSCAISSGISALLNGYGWFNSMDIPSRISLFRNHCRRNKNGFPILNISDIGAVWPLGRGGEGPALPLELLLDLMASRARTSNRNRNT